MTTMNSSIFNQQNYVIIKNVISKDVCELLSDYANFKAKLKPNAKTGDSLAGVHREYGDLLMETLLAKLKPKVEEATGLELLPTLSFYYTYQHGHQLTPHKDRSSCQIVAGLCIDADDAFKINSGCWPLVLNLNGIVTPMRLDYGDMVIFKGHEIEHWREVFQGKWFVSAIFAYVDKNGPFNYQKYDQRKALGRSHVGMFRWLLGCLKHKVTSKTL